MLESKFQADLVQELKARFPGCFVLKNDSSYMQGIPDLLVLFDHHWVALECKRNPYSSNRPNQLYYLDLLNEMSYAAIIHPENKEEVLDEIQQIFTPRRSSRSVRRE